MPDRWLDADLVAPGLDEAVRLAHFIAGGGSAAVHLIDQQWQHRIAAVNAPLVRTPVADSMCRQVIDDDAEIYSEDATKLDRFRGNVFTMSGDVRLYNATPLRAQDGEPVGTLCVFDSVARGLTAEQRDRLDDVASQVSHQLNLAALARRLADDALHDPLTGVANRILLSERLTQALERRRRNKGDLVVVLLDLDGFKTINDELGHSAGDQLLIELARRLVQSVRAEDTVARLGGDEFVVLVEQAPGQADSAVVEQRVCSVFDQPYKLGIREIAVAGSVGAIVPRVDELSYEILGRADQAMYEVKRRRKGTAQAG